MRKKTIYLIASMFLGFLLSIIGYAFLEKSYINNSLSLGNLPASYGGNWVLPPYLSAIFILGGVIFGYVLGIRWWQIVYVEKRHWRKK